MIGLLDNRAARALRRIRRELREATDPAARQRRHAVNEDLEETRRDVGSFIGKGAECETRGEVFAVLTFTNVPFKAKFYSLVAKAMQMEGYTPLIVGDGHHRNGEIFYDLFGFTNRVHWDEYLKSIPAGEIDAAYERLKPARLTVAAARACRLGNVQVGTYALSTACRQLRRFPPDLEEPEFRAMFDTCLRDSIASALAAERLLDAYPIRKLMLRDIGYTPNGPILDVALARGVDCFTNSNAQRAGAWVFKRYTAENPGEHEFSISHPAWKRIVEEPWTPEMDRRIATELTDRYTPDSAGDTRRLQTGKQMLPPDEVRRMLNLDPDKKTAVIFAHVSWDGAFFFGEDLYENFDEWLLAATRHAIANPNLNWIVKLHPLNMLHQMLAGGGAVREAEMAYLEPLEPLPSHVRILHADTPINTYSLFPIIDYALTVRGTIGLELPCFGIPTLTAGTGRYERRGFTIDSASVEEYEERLRTLHTVPALSDDVRRLARIHYYHLMIRRQVSFEDIAPMQIRQMHEADVNTLNTIRINAKSLEDVRNAPSMDALMKWIADPKELDFFDPREM